MIDPRLLIKYVSEKPTAEKFGLMAGIVGI
jgi:hypothetical protein